jgi:hypothetical protein
MRKRSPEGGGLPWFRWLRWLAVCVALFVAWQLASRWYDNRKATREFEEIAAELDRSDPGWRWEEIEARREQIPEGDSAAERLLAAAKMLPKDWPNQPELVGQQPAGDPMVPPAAQLPPAKTVLDQLREIEPNYQLTEDLVDQLRAQVGAVAEPVAEARKVINLPRGRYTVKLAHNPINTLVPHLRNLDTLTALLHLDAVLRLRQEGGENACGSLEALLSAARTVRDEPWIISVLVRIRAVGSVVGDLERVLGQGELSPEMLRKFSVLLREEEDEAQRALVAAVRGERAMHNVLLKRMTDGELSMTALDPLSKPTTSEKLSDWYVGRPLANSNRAPMLRYMTEILQLAGHSRSERGGRVEAIEFELLSKKSDAKYRMCALLIPALSKVLDAHDRQLAQLGCARTALAAEAFRLAHQGIWPQTVDELVPEFLKEVPINPFSDEPPLMEERDGVLIISAPGSDEVRGVAPVGQREPIGPRPLVRFRLWKPEARAVPPDQIP